MIKTETRLSVSDCMLLRLTVVFSYSANYGILNYQTIQWLAEMHTLLPEVDLRRLASRSRVLK